MTYKNVPSNQNEQNYKTFSCSKKKIYQVCSWNIASKDYIKKTRSQLSYNLISRSHTSKIKRFT